MALALNVVDDGIEDAIRLTPIEPLAHEFLPGAASSLFMAAMFSVASRRAASDSRVLNERSSASLYRSQRCVSTSSGECPAGVSLHKAKPFCDGLSPQSLAAA